MIRAVLIAVLLALAAGQGVARDDPSGEAVTAAAEAAGALSAETQDWVALAQRAVAALEAGRASNRAFEALREELAAARERFAVAQTANGGRLRTLDRQIAALGPPPETGEEAAEIAALRSDLQARRAALQAPVAAAAEDFAEADGLIAEIDTLLRQRQTERFFERSDSPLAPAAWPAAVSSVLAALRTMQGEVELALASPSRRDRATDALPATLAWLALAAVLVLRGRRWAARLERRLRARSLRGRGVWSLLVSLGRVLLPFIGLVALTQALLSTGLLGRRLTGLAEALPWIGLNAIIAHWLASRFRAPPDSAIPGPLGLDPAAEQRLSRAFLYTGYAVAIYAFADVFLDVDGIEGIPKAVILFPFGVALAAGVFRMGRLLVRHRPEPAEARQPQSFRSTVMALIGRLLIAVSVVGTGLAALGYDAAFEMAVIPAVATLYLLAILVLLQRLVFDLYALLTGAEEGADGLIPVSIAFLLALAAMPPLALIWGARATDLTELWTRFQEGFTFGETRISPSNFLIFVAVFVAGYTVVRLVQGALRSTVLPKTRLDIGGQNAVSVGVGYVGIFVAAVIAITTAGIDLSGLAIVAGALSVGIGFGLQNIVSNFVSGIILLIERPISEGDWIEVGGQMGYVRDISVRSTRIETFDRTDVIIPNADLVSGTVTNYTRGNSVGRLIVPVGVAYGTDTRRVTAILREIAEAHPMVLLEPPPAVLFIGFGASSLDFEMRMILRDVTFIFAVRTEINHKIAERFTAEGIEIPFAQQDIWLRNPEVLPGAAPKPAAAATESAGPGPHADPTDGADPVPDADPKPGETR